MPGSRDGGKFRSFSQLQGGNQVPEKIDDNIINFFTYLSMLWSFITRNIKRRPRLALVLVTLSSGAFCIYHALILSGNKPFFSLAGLILALVATPGLILYKDEASPRQRRLRPDILSTDNDWFAERERA